MIAEQPAQRNSSSHDALMVSVGWIVALLLLFAPRKDWFFRGAKDDIRLRKSRPIGAECAAEAVDVVER